VKSLAYVILPLAAFVGYVSIGSLLHCGGGWSDADAKSLTDATRLELDTYQLVENVDGGSPTRALSRAAFCANASVLFRHGVSIPDSGIVCQP
jgi:hypothetical protein